MGCDSLDRDFFSTSLKYDGVRSLSVTKSLGIWDVYKYKVLDKGGIDRIYMFCYKLTDLGVVLGHMEMSVLRSCANADCHYRLKFVNSGNCSVLAQENASLSNKRTHFD